MTLFWTFVMIITLVFIFAVPRIDLVLPLPLGLILNPTWNALVAAFLQQLLKVVGISQKWPEFLSLAS